MVLKTDSVKWLNEVIINLILNCFAFKNKKISLGFRNFNWENKTEILD